MDNQADKGNNFEFWDNLLDQLAGYGKETGMEEVSSSFTLSTPMAAPSKWTLRPIASCESLLNICHLLRGGLSEFVLVLLRRPNGGFVFFLIYFSSWQRMLLRVSLSHCSFLDFKEINFICAVSHLIGWKSPKPVTPSPCFWPLPSHRVGSYSQISTKISTLIPPVQITQNIDFHCLGY